MLQRQTLTAEVSTMGVTEYSSPLRADHDIHTSSSLDFLQPLELVRCAGHRSDLLDLESIMRRNHRQSVIRRIYMFHLDMAVMRSDKSKNASNSELEHLINEFVKLQDAANSSCARKLLDAKGQLNQLHLLVLQLASKINGTTAAIQSLQESVQAKMEIVSNADKLQKEGLSNCSKKASMVQAKSQDLSDMVSIDFQKAEMTSSNLGGLGPDTGVKEMLFQNVGVVDGQPFDLVITNTTLYAAKNVKMNNQVAQLGGSINGKAPEPLGFQFRFVRSGTRTPVTLKEFYFSFLDLDKHGRRCSEQIEIRGFEKYYVTRASELRISTAVDGYTKFAASTHHQTGDNPKDVNNLTPKQANRAVTLLFARRSDFDVIFTVAKCKKGSGNLFFTGSTSLVTKSQGEAHSVGVQEQTCENGVTAEYMRNTASVRNKMSDEVKELMRRTDELPRLRFQTHDASEAQAKLKEHILVLSKACKALPATISDLDSVRKAIDALKSCPGLAPPKFQTPTVVGRVR